MTQQEWDTFTELLDEVVNLPGMNWREIKVEVIERCREGDYGEALKEFVGWFGGKVE